MLVSASVTVSIPILVSCISVSTSVPVSVSYVKPIEMDLSLEKKHISGLENIGVDVG